MQVAKQRFYEEGFHHTGINQLIKEADTAKASFYDHFPSKEALGIQVVRSFGRDILVWFRQILRRSRDPEGFVKAFSRAVHMQTQSEISYYQGCPIAVFSCQFPIGKEPFSQEFRSIAAKWEKTIIDQLERWKALGKLAPGLDTRALALDIINIYEGCLVNWRITGSKEYIDRMEKLLGQLLVAGTSDF